jgi:hypothetical protein
MQKFQINDYVKVKSNAPVRTFLSIKFEMIDGVVVGVPEQTYNIDTLYTVRFMPSGFVVQIHEDDLIYDKVTMRKKKLKLFMADEK